MRKIILPFILLFITSAWSQELITGLVQDETGVPLAGVSIAVENSSKGTTTDFDGIYEIEVEMGETLVFSYVGFDTMKRKVTSSGKLNVVLQSGIALDDVVVVGSRNPARTTVNSPVPIDVIDVQELISTGPQVNLNQILNYVAPSFTSNTQTIADGTDHVDPASLRGLGPDQILVLINGKRRHTSSLININGSFGRGSVGTDLNAIPSASIKRIEVLRDGAAAQYGSDAIAGVINIVLNTSVNKLSINATTGANFSRHAQGQEGGVDGETTNISANYGIGLGDRGGYINFTGDFDYRDSYNRMKEFEGSIFNGYNAVERVANADGYDISNLFTDVDAIKQYGSQVSYFSPEMKNNIQNATTIEDLQDLLGDNVTEDELIARSQNRSDYNMRVGQSELRGGRFFANFSLPVDDQGTELYSFAGISSRTGGAAGFYRLPNQSRTYTPAYINGFLPEINSKIKDKSISVGIKGMVNEWNVDFSNTWGQNSFLYEIDNTSNTSMLNASPSLFDAGGFSFTQNTTNLDLNHFYDNVFEGLNVAFGGEYRFEKYDIIAGEEASYVQYDVNGAVITNINQQPPVDFFGNSRPGGSQVFPGFRPENEVSRERSSIAGYVDLEADITEKLLLTFATRFENYSDFGSTINFKLSSLYKLNDNFNLRGAASTGFRAPSLHQLNFNSTSTIFADNGDPVEVGTFSNNSRVAELLGIPELKEEESQSVSAGFTAKIPSANLSFTLDGFFVRIEDRVIYTGRFAGPGTGSEIDVLLAQANAEEAAFFANAIDTETKGFDLVITQKASFNDKIHLKNDLSAAVSVTRQVGDIHASQVLEDAGQVDTYFSESSRIYLEKAVPRVKVNFSNLLSSGKYTVFLRNVFFGEVTEAANNLDQQDDYSPKIVTDLSFGYQLTSSLNMSVGANNLFDVYPDRAQEDNRSSGRFDWSRSAQQFGIGGRFLYARLRLDL
ncbi:TonB-dependent receptor [Joostella atrarenae]|uniref:TonB-dependent receptor n=1 Tax=Joostella atrarenae TaxID=679257 RepID=A0ABS9J3F0_9FLAO|nr:TonB-dependent receptor [Joostella atrarenae]MCF8714961.1 TonB-dependent receptor [Joostella atrarenae]